MMLTIPDRYKPALAQLIGLRGRHMQLLAAAIEQSPPSATIGRLAESLAQSAKPLGLELWDLYDVVQMLVSLYRVRTEQGDSSEEFVDGLLEAIRFEGDPSLTPKAANVAKLRQSLIRIFSADRSLGVSAKVSEVLYEHERHICRGICRVLTDLRAVFSDSPAEKPAAAVVVHMLKIGYHQGDDVNEFYVAMDARDIRAMQEMLSRAVEKEKTLEETMRNTGVLVLGFDQE